MQPYPIPFDCPVPTVNSKMRNHKTFKLRQGVTNGRINWQSNCEIKRSKIKVTGVEKGRAS